MSTYELEEPVAPYQGMTQAELQARVREMTRGRRSLVEDVGRSALGPTGSITEKESGFLVQVVRRGLGQEADPTTN
ncbi:MAG: hypothetical protein AAB541_02695 [Patescibacteria group bacterium]